MSVDVLILLAFFVLVPLLQRWLAQARERDQPTPQPAQRRPLPGPSPAAPAPRPPAPPTPPLPAPEADLLDMNRSARARDAVTHAATVSSRPRRVASALLRTPLDVRRAIAAAAILGPCRAEDPHD